jgi:hypothetical protein
MKNNDPFRELRKFGVMWIVMAPIGWLMAAISTVKDETFYQAQLVVFTLAAAVAVVFGVAAILRQAWARPGLVAVSWFASLVFIAPGLVLLVLSLRPMRWEIALMAVSIALFGLPFAAMALQLQRLGSRLNAASERHPHPGQ